MLLLALTLPAWGADILVDVGDDWCAALTSAQAGDRVLLAPGTHEGSCTVTPAGDASAAIVLTAQDSERRATLTTSDASGNLLDLLAGYLQVEGIDFGPTPVNVEAIRLRAGGNLLVRDATFDSIGGIAVVANSAGASYADITVEDSVFTNLSTSAVVIGCQAGAADCSGEQVVVQRNRISGVDSGDGIVFAVDTTGTIASNTLQDVAGTAIRVGGDVNDAGTGIEGPTDGVTPSSTVENNHIDATSGDAALVVEGGPALIRNNVAVGGAQATFWTKVPTLAARIDHLHVLGNTFTGPHAVTLEGWRDGTQVSFQNNAVFDETTPGAGIPEATPDTEWGGNVDCASTDACFVALDAFDPSPRSGGALVSASVLVSNGLLDTDLCGEARAAGTAAGALLSSLESPFEPSIDTDPTLHCTAGGDDSGDSGTGGDDGTGDDGSIIDASPDAPGGLDTGPEPPRLSAAMKANEPGGVSCTTSTASWSMAWGAWLLALLVRRRSTDSVND